MKTQSCHLRAIPHDFFDPDCHTVDFCGEGKSDVLKRPWVYSSRELANGGSVPAIDAVTCGLVPKVGV